MKTAIIVGHTKIRQGATSPYLCIPTEWRFNKLIAEKLREVATVFYYDSYTTGYTAMVKRMSRRINADKFDLVLELHFNAAAEETGHGAEALYYFKNEKAKELGSYFCELMEKRLKIKSRGVKALYNKHQRGFAAVYHPKPTVLILEPFFGSNQNDCLIMNNSGAINTYITILKDIIKGYKYDSKKGIGSN
ncbi:N-acetylmuramoyl-L-alanine amidase [Aquimarina aggregata]|uniref:N-acetylmuramoyl-L-alanine amidase n=1 Tax=Aquimarina aggregata TaxID=1642818 RepID=UPI002490BCF2|nr:N-acetylmuramoyl-L-alanine amidase [Aquimarina aggregata]